MHPHLIPALCKGAGETGGLLKLTGAKNNQDGAALRRNCKEKEAQGQEGVEILGFYSLMGVWVDGGGNGWVVNL